VTAGGWTVEISAEVERWYVSLKDSDRAYADVALERLRERGTDLRMPHSRPLGDGLHELRFACERVARRITYYVNTERKIITLTTFRKQRQNEKSEVGRARRSMDARRSRGT
jgi:phage-related protein